MYWNMNDTGNTLKAAWGLILMTLQEAYDEKAGQNNEVFPLGKI